MSKTNNTHSAHEQLVRKISEEMAIECHEHSYKVYVKFTTSQVTENTWAANFYRNNWNLIASRYIPQARIAVKHMAESFKEGYDQAWADKTDFESPLPDRHLRILGLIPSPDQPEGTGK